jgi:rod shape-determining protein MreC
MLVLASLTIITLDYRGEARRIITSVQNGARDGLSPLQHLVADVLHPVGNFFSGMVNYGGVVGENSRLETEVGQLRRQLLEQQAASQQLNELLQQQHLPWLGGIETVPAQVINGPTSNFQVTIEIDKGTGDGVGVGLPVVSGAGLVGQVIAAGASTATVQLLTDTRSRVGVRLPAGAIGVAAGQGYGEQLQLQDVLVSAPALKGQVAYTSGLSGAAYPSGIPVGTVTSVSSGAGSLTKQITLAPLANLATLQYVTVLQWLPPA